MRSLDAFLIGLLGGTAIASRVPEEYSSLFAGLLWGVILVLLVQKTPINYWSNRDA